MKAEVEEAKVETEGISQILKNQNLINWAKKNGAGEIKANAELEKQALEFGIKTTINSIGLMDKNMVKMFITDSDISLKTHTKISLELIAEVIKTLGTDGDLIIGDQPNRLAVIRVSHDSEILATVERIAS